MYLNFDTNVNVKVKIKNAQYSEKALLGLSLQFDDLGLDLCPFMPPHLSPIPQPEELSYAVETHHGHKK